MYAVLNFFWTPKQFAQLDIKEKAFVIACIDNRIEAEESANKKIESKMKKK